MRIIPNQKITIFVRYTLPALQNEALLRYTGAGKIDTIGSEKAAGRYYMGALLSCGVG